MAGYNGYSMSNNAVEAYKSGAKPLSKWKKDDFISYAEENFSNKENYVEKIEELKKINIAGLKDKFLYNSSWHHTSKEYNKTNFYSIDEIEFEEFFETENEKREKEEKRLKLFAENLEKIKIEEQEKAKKKAEAEAKMKNFVNFKKENLKIGEKITIYYHDELITAEIIKFDFEKDELDLILGFEKKTFVLSLVLKRIFEVENV